MSDEKRQTRLLPFRRRRAARFGPEDFAVSDGVEDFANVRGDEDHSADAELTALLRAWEAPPPPLDDARARLLADFRAVAPARPLWRRALTAELRVPLPVAACAALALFASLFTLGARGWTRTVPAEASKTTDAPEVKVVEVPVVEERVVTRTVYVEKKERAAVRISPRQAPPREEEREALAQGSAREGSEADAGRPAEKESNAGYFTRVNMEDFQPANEVKMRIVSRGGTDER